MGPAALAFFILNRNRPRCLAPTADRGECQNYRDTCPHHSDGRSAVAPGASISPSAPLAADVVAVLSGQSGPSRDNDPQDTSPQPKAALEERAQNEVRWTRPHDTGQQLPNSRQPTSNILQEEGVDALRKEAADHYGLTKDEVLRDMHLVRVLYALRDVLGENMVMARPRKNVNEPAGQFVFRGGTSLVSAWDVCERYSVDLDLLFGGWWHLNRRRLRNTLRQLPERVAYTCGTQPAPSDRPTIRSLISFFGLPIAGVPKPVSVDVAAMPHHPPPVRIEHRQVMSLAGRLAAPEMLERCPFLGGFTVPALGPGSIAMEKLLPQVQMAGEPSTDGIEERARDWYDLGRIALCADQLSGNLEHEGAALLGVAEWWLQLFGDPVSRPAGGFASLPTVRKGTPEYRILVDAYNQMHNKDVWGESLPLDDAIELSLTLDPGAPEPYLPT